MTGSVDVLARVRPGLMGLSAFRIWCVLFKPVGGPVEVMDIYAILERRPSIQRISHKGVVRSRREWSRTTEVN